MVRPIDLQDNMSKAPLAAREQAIQQSSAEIGQRSAAVQAETERILDQSRTIPTQELDPQENRVDDHERNQRGHEGHGGNRSDQQEDEVDQSDDNESSGDYLIDVVA